MAANTPNTPNLFQMLPAIMSGQMGLDQICRTFGIERTELKEGEAAAAGLDRLVTLALEHGVVVNEGTGTIRGVPFRCIIVSKGNLF